MIEIKSSEITFLIQGPINPVVNLSIQQIKIFSPDSKIIISTTDITPGKITGFDEFVSCEDPGFFYYSKRKNASPNNINRQIKTTLAGLKKVKTKYCFKLRSDFLIKGDGWLKFYSRFDKQDDDYQFLKQKVITCCYISRKPAGFMPYPYHISDLLFFGLTADLHTIFDIPYMYETEAYSIGKHRLNLFTPEQHIFINALKKSNRKVFCSHYNDSNATNQLETEKYFASSFIFLNFSQFECQPTKDHFSIKLNPHIFKNSYTHNEWLNLYKTYLDQNIQIPKIDYDRIEIDESYRNFKIKFNISKLLTCWLPYRNLRVRFRNSLLKQIISL